SRIGSGARRAQSLTGLCPVSRPVPLPPAGPGLLPVPVLLPLPGLLAVTGLLPVACILPVALAVSRRSLVVVLRLVVAGQASAPGPDPALAAAHGAVAAGRLALLIALLVGAARLVALLARVPAARRGIPSTY